MIPLLGLKYWDFVYEFYIKITNTGTKHSLQHWGVRGKVGSQAVYDKITSMEKSEKSKATW